MFKKTSQIFLFRIIGLICLFATSILLSKELSLTEYGRFETLVKLSLLLSTISIFGIDSKLNQNEKASILDRNNGLIWSAIINSILLVILAMFYLIFYEIIKLNF